jgi:DNA polymerase III subunit beta
MKFSVSASALAAALGTVTRALSARALNPILEGVLIESADHGIRLTCADGNTAITALVDATIDTEGAAVAPGRLFTEFVRRSGTGFLSVNVAPNRSIRVTCGGSRMNLAGLNPDEFPRPNLGDCKRRVTLPHAILREMLEKTLPMIAPADLREVLTGCYLETRGGNATMVGMDGFRLAKLTHVCSAIPDEVSAIIPGKAAAELQRLLKGNDDALCALEFSSNGVHAKLGGVEIYASLIAGRYVDYARVIPTDFATRVRVDTETLRDSVDRAAIIAKGGGTQLLRLRIDDETMHVEADSEIANAHEELPIRKSGNDISIAFNVKYIADALRSIDTPELEFAFNSSVHPCIVTSPDQSDYIILILPERTSHSN